MCECTPFRISSLQDLLEVDQESQNHGDVLAFDSLVSLQETGKTLTLPSTLAKEMSFVVEYVSVVWVGCFFCADSSFYFPSLSFSVAAMSYNY